MERKEIEKILDCMGIQIEKAKKSLDGVDTNLTEAYKAMDAIQFDYDMLKARIRND